MAKWVLPQVPKLHTHPPYWIPGQARDDKKRLFPEYSVFSLAPCEKLGSRARHRASLFPNDLDQDALFTTAIEFTIEYLFPGAKI